MLSHNSPLSVSLVDNLSNYDINSDSFRLGNISIEGDRYICVKENVNENTQVVVLNLYNKSNTRKYMKAESVIIHPNDPILALRGNIKNVSSMFLQVFNIETKEKICSCQLNEYMTFWKWISHNTIVIVCEKNVYHWTIDIHNLKRSKENYTLTKIFEKAQIFIDNNAQILNYSTDKEMKWCVLCGISTKDQGKTIDGHIQLYSCEKKLHQTIEGFIGCFGSFIFDNFELKPLFCFIEKKRNNTISRLHLMDIYSSKTEGSTPYKLVKEINLINENVNDFPIYINMSTLHGVIFIVTKCSYVYVLDEGTLTVLVKEKVSEDNIFVCCENKNGEGVYAVNKKGKIFFITINCTALINHIKLSNSDFKDRILKNLEVKYGYPGCDYISAYKKCINEMDFKKASKLICLMKNPKVFEEYSSSVSEAILIMKRKKVDVRLIPPLRSQQVMNTFKSFKNASGQLSPLLLYFSVLLEFDKLNTYESIELVKPVIVQKKKEYLGKWIRDDKLTCSEELGDLVRKLNLRLALIIYLRCDSHNKVVATYCLLNMFNNVLSYINNFKQFNFDFLNIFVCIMSHDFIASPADESLAGSSSGSNKDLNVSTDSANASKTESVSLFNGGVTGTDTKQSSVNSEIAIQFIKLLCENNITFDINGVVDFLLSKKKLQEATSILLDYLKENKPEHKHLQTKLFEFNLYNNVQVAETLFQMDIFAYYDKYKIACLCEEKGLYQRALENFTNLADIRRVIAKASSFQRNENISNFENDATTLGTSDSVSSSVNKGISVEWIKNYFSKLSDSVCQDILFDLMKNSKANMKIIIPICVQYCHKIGIKKIIYKFEENKNYEGIFYFVSSILTDLQNFDKGGEEGIMNSKSNSISSFSNFNKSSDEFITGNATFNSGSNMIGYTNMTDEYHAAILSEDGSHDKKKNFASLKLEDVHYIMFKYIEACAKINNIQELDRICKDRHARYNPEQVKNFLKECKLSDPRPLIYVCDIHNFIEELAEYLYKNSLLKYIEVYVIKVNPANAYKVIGVLIDLDASEEFLLNLLNNIKNISNIGSLIEIAEKRNRLKLLLPWIESRANDGNENKELHNALAKIYIDLNRDPEHFLKTNNFYDKKLIGKYCEDLDPHLAYTAYERANGECDEELINITNKNGLFKLQAKYLVSRQSINLWKMVLDESNQYRKNVIDQVIGSTLIESNNAEEITTTVKAFIEKKLSSELIELLEKIVLHNSEFNDNKNLQNLLILTAIKSDSKKVMEYINRLDNFSGPQIATIAYEYNLREEAFVIYKKFNYFTSAISVLLDNILYEKKTDKNNRNISKRKKGKLIKDASFGRVSSSGVGGTGNMSQNNNLGIDENEEDRYLDQFAELEYKDEGIDGEEEEFRKNVELEEEEEAEDHLNNTLNNYKNENVEEEEDDEVTLKNYEEDLSRAIEFAQKCNNTDVWFILGRAQLKLNKIIDAIDSFMKSNNPESYKEIIEKCLKNNYYEHLITYLNTLRDKNGLKDVLIDSELLYSYAKLKKKSEMTKFINSTNTANLQLIGDRLYKEQEYKMARILYSHIPNNQKLAICFLKMKEYSLAIEAAKKAKSPKTWKEVNYVCVKEKQLKFAHTAGLQLIMHADHLDEIIKIYERRKYINELMSLLENGLNNERAHVGIYTELGILYAKYKPEKLMEFIRNYTNKINTRKLIDVCQNEYLLKEAVYLFISYDEYNLAVDTIIKHSPIAYTPDTFMQVIHKVTNSDIIYRVIDFYVEEHPLNLYSLLTILEKKIDNNRLVQTLKKSNNLPLIQKYLEDIQAQNITAVNETLNEIYLKNDDYISLRNSIDEYDNFNQTNLINKLENHSLPEMRRIAALLYKKNKKYKEAINLSKKEKQYKDAIEIARVSKNNIYIEDLINHFIEIKNKEAFCACLIVCYDLLKPDYILETVWLSGFKDQAMLYFIQIVSDYSNQIDIMKKQIEDMQKEKKLNKSAPNDYSDAAPIVSEFTYSLNNNLSIMPRQSNYKASGSFDKYDMFNSSGPNPNLSHHI